MNVLQLQAAHDISDRVAVVACPGSGKTTTLVAAIEHDIERGNWPDQIAAITYTNAAARVLKDRIKVGLAHCGTLHGLCLKIMLQSNPLLKLIDENEAERLLLISSKELGYKGTDKELSEARRNHWKKEMAFGSYSEAQRVVLKFHAMLLNANLMEYDMLLASAYRRIVKGASLAQAYYVDEAQDWSEVDAHIYHALPKQRLYAVGDPNQAIFGFRGGNPYYLIELHRAQSVSNHILPINYRSTQKIVHAANELIQHNQERIDFKMVTENGDGPECLAYVEPTTDSHDRRLGQLVMAKIQTGSVAVLCRTNEDVAHVKAYLVLFGCPVSTEVYEGIPDLARVRTLLGLALDPKNPVLHSIEMGQRHSDKKLPVENWHPAASVDEAMRILDEYHAPTAPMKVLLDQMRADCPNESPGQMFGYLRKNNYTPEESGNIQVQTIHWSKGQEFDHVILALADEPIGRDDDEEERRLYYVAITRARKSVAAVASLKRFVKFVGMTDRSLVRYVTQAGFITISKIT